MFYVQLAICILWFALASIISIVIACFRPRNPSGGYIFTVIFNYVIRHVVGVKVKIHHFERLDANRPCIYIANHQSNFDIYTMSHTYRPRTVVIGKKELLWVPVFNLLFYLTGNILLNRGNHEKAMAGMQMARDFLNKKKISIYIFPEGTRNKGAQKLLPFKKGAFHIAVDAGVPLVPIVSAPITNFLERPGRRFLKGTYDIEVLEPIVTKGLTQADVPQLIAQAQAQMQAAFDRLRETSKPDAITALEN